ncbi:hypothetical protein JAAARDRAFT_137111 [Jaapia argillacea MUCL 33604]|uniref:HAT C-terminal dimerisation domain-containing protein n=1 Tax=Jaapia argillacea MUCL 33604 TaxID=933084 RepID=A0A067PF50_9AGAM|nr:hypothetical protein JAAARDRAFT_137111 [Jaapia argillacea MUCL 33604]
MAKAGKFAEIKTSIEAGLANMGKWYQRTDTSAAYFISLVLNPAYKLAYFEDKWDDEWLSPSASGKGEYFRLQYISTYFDLKSIQTDIDPTLLLTLSASYSKSWMMSTVLTCCQLERKKRDPQQELKEYLDSPLIVDLHDDGLIRWWGHHSTQYPILSKMACDYLAIQGSAVSAERAFLSGAITGTHCCNRLSPDIFEALQLLKSTYRNGRVILSEPCLDATMFFNTADDVE